MSSEELYPFCARLNINGAHVCNFTHAITTSVLGAGRGICTGTFGLDGAFPPNDPSSGSYTQFKFIYIFHITDAP